MLDQRQHVKIAVKKVVTLLGELSRLDEVLFIE